MRPVLLCLHGWGGSKESFTELRTALEGADLEILTPDLPGFGDEAEPDKPWNNDDYADWVVGWLGQQLKMENARLSHGQGKWKIDRKIFLLGHSHGGRIAMKLAARLHEQKSNFPLSTFHFPFPIDHLFLCAPAGIRHPRHFKRIIGLTLAKAGKFLLSIPGMRTLQPLGKKLLYRLVRVHDYEKASPVMRQTMINVSAEDLRPILHLINVPTDIFWGTEDRMTPVSDARILADGITAAECHTHVFPGVRHNVHRAKAEEIADIIRSIDQ